MSIVVHQDVAKAAFGEAGKRGDAVMEVHLDISVVGQIFDEPIILLSLRNQVTIIEIMFHQGVKF